MSYQKTWAWIWRVLAIIVLGFEAAALILPGNEDTLSWHVIALTTEKPEIFGTGIVLILCWLIFHWFVWPIWRRR